MSARENLVPVLLEKVYALIQSKIDPSKQEIVRHLAQHLFSNVAYDDLRKRNESDLYGAIISLWHHICESGPKKTSINVFNPAVSKDGWQSTHTIIEIVLPDSPFLVDSIKMALTRLGLTFYFMLNGPMQVARDKNNDVIGLNNGSGDFTSLFHIEVERLSADADMKKLHDELKQVLGDAAHIVRDWKAMSQQLEAVIKEIEVNKDTIPEDNERCDEIIEFLRWLGKHNYTFMAYKEYDLVKTDDEMELKPSAAPGLGLLASPHRVRAVNLKRFTDEARLEACKPYLLIVTKGNTLSRIHRPAYTDYIGIKKFDKNGVVIGEHRFSGLYTSAVYNQTIESIPLIREKTQRILAASGYREGSHSYKALHNILENYPRDELIQAKEHELLEIGVGVVQMQDRDLVKLFVRKDPFGRFFSCMVYMTKDRYNTLIRMATQRILKNYFGCEQEVEFTTYFSESPLTRTHYIVRVDSTNNDVDVKLLEQNLHEAASSWDDRLAQAIVANYGESKGIPLSKAYQAAFPRSYKEDFMPILAVSDVKKLEKLTDEHPLDMLLYRPQEAVAASKAVNLKLYHANEPIHLSDVLPMLENLGLRVIEESPYEVVKARGQRFWILDFSMLLTSGDSINIEQSRNRFQQAFAGVLRGEYENDGFNRLILSAGLTGREVTVLRAYARYMRQIGFPFSFQYIEETLNHYPALAACMISLFSLRFDPNVTVNINQSQEELLEHILAQLEQVESIDDDRIIRRYLDIICATVRTNYYQLDELGHPKPWLSLKISPRDISDLPKPVPAFEIFVYSTDVEGTHLRGGKVARGGLRWSDRQEDFRTEVLGLMKAQQVKNTVIVPVGAKGGFVCKKQALFSSRDDIFAEGQRCYKQFIRALLDVTDNIIDGVVVGPERVVRHDPDDPYLVVAADKGTATFSDLANSVSQEYQFWLGDAFASGGSNGYDHKAMGITAKGAWESVKRHFREMGINCQKTNVTVVGIGDMAGDVFGNGMLLSKHIQLVAAFNHLHIFIDPQPDPKSSVEERQRLFSLPRSSWEDYNLKLISKGGGVFSRKAKSIPLSAEMQQMLGTSVKALPPTDLIHLLLKMPVDLLWNGGIGTYIKASSETHLDVGDRANDALRVDGAEVKAKVVGEGGNLGMTQLGRIEYSLAGGRVNTDFVDNVGGVDCSDNEVNIKILLNGLVAQGDMTLKQRNSLLESMESEISDIVLEDAYLQSESISISMIKGTHSVKENMRFIHALEKAGQLDRALEYLPDDETLLGREKKGAGLTRPELSVLIAYGKMVLKESFVHPDIANDHFLAKQLTNYFPSKLRSKYVSSMLEHPLKAELVATALANQMVNEMGCNFVTRLQEETGATAVDIAKAYAASREIYHLDATLDEIRGLDNKAPTQLQYTMIHMIRRIIRRLTRWLLRNKEDIRLSVQELVSLYESDVQRITSHLEDMLVPEELAEHNEQAQAWIEQGISESLAHYVSRLSSLYAAMDIACVARELDQSVINTGRVYFILGDKLSLHWFLRQIVRQSVNNNWQLLARASFREELDWQQRQLTSLVLQCCGENSCDISNQETVVGLIDDWIVANKTSLVRWENILNEFKVGATHEFAKFSVALRELSLLNLNCLANK